MDGGIYEFDFDADGLLEGITDPNGLAIAYLYNIGTTLPDPTAPRGALLEVEHANGTLVEYGYDSLNRLDSLVNRSSLGSVMSSFGYTYDDVGNITRIDLAGGDAWVYQYDDVYQLTREERRNPSDAAIWHRAYEYDDAGNRTKMTWDDHGTIAPMTSYEYNSLNQLKDLIDLSSSAACEYEYDDNGNREQIIGPSGTLDLDWSIDDRLLSVNDGTNTVEYAYDHMGQRILRRAHDGIRTRYFFAGLTEEIVKTSVPGAHTDNAFAVEVAIEAGDDTAWNQGVGSGATIGSVYDEERRKDVTHFLHPAMDCHQRFDAPITSTTKRVISLWHRRDWDCGQIVVHASTSAGQVRINYRRDAGTDWVDTSGSTWAYYVHLDLPTGEWNRVEQDIAADIQRLTPAVQYQSAHGVWLWGRAFRVDDIRFSNAMTTERNSLLPGSIGQVAYRERWEGTGGSPTPTYGGSARGGGQRRWNSYNHIGNVVGTSDANGYFVESVDTDAFGNPLASTQTGEWAAGLGGNRGLTTKELDPAAGLYYFYQRWYDPQTATFASRAPYPPMMEHAYGYGEGNPSTFVDSCGKFPTQGDATAMLQGLCVATCGGLFGAALKTTEDPTECSPCDYLPIANAAYKRLAVTGCKALNKIVKKKSHEIMNIVENLPTNLAKDVAAHLAKKACLEMCSRQNVFTHYGQRQEICGAARDCVSTPQGQADVSVCAPLMRLCEEAGGNTGLGPPR